MLRRMFDVGPIHSDFPDSPFAVIKLTAVLSAKFFSTHVPVQEFGSGFGLGFMLKLGLRFEVGLGVSVRVKVGVRVRNILDRNERI